MGYLEVKTRAGGKCKDQECKEASDSEMRESESFAHGA